LGTAQPYQPDDLGSQETSCMQGKQRSFVLHTIKANLFLTIITYYRPIKAQIFILSPVDGQNKQGGLVHGKCNTLCCLFGLSMD
jgi:hypothetical protein